MRRLFRRIRRVRGRQAKEGGEGEADRNDFVSRVRPSGTGYRQVTYGTGEVHLITDRVDACFTVRRSQSLRNENRPTHRIERSGLTTDDNDFKVGNEHRARSKRAASASKGPCPAEKSPWSYGSRSESSAERRRILPSRETSSPCRHGHSCHRRHRNSDDWTRHGHVYRRRSSAISDCTASAAPRAAPAPSPASGAASAAPRAASTASALPTAAAKRTLRVRMLHSDG